MPRGRVFIPIVITPGGGGESPGRTNDKEADELELIRLINLARNAEGLGSLQRQTTLGIAAQSHNQDMATNNFVGHTGSDGSSAGVRAERAGYADWLRIGETIAMGQLTPAQTVQDWLNSPSHRAIIMNPNYTDIGAHHLAFERAGTMFQYWTAIFGTR
jgi:uncharacterized protein YkwD